MTKKATNDKSGNESPVISIAKNSNVQPDFSQVAPALKKILTALSESPYKPTMWHWQEATRVLTNLAEQKAPLAIVIISTFEKTIFQEGKLKEGYEMLDTFVRPEHSFLHSESPCPPAFMQGRNLLIDKVNANLDDHVTDPNFWWQPITNPVAYNLVESIKALQEKCLLGQGVDFFNIKNLII